MKKDKNRLLVILLILFIFIASTLFGGYILVDKVLVPKYFSSFNITNLKELIEIADTIYTIPDEREFIKNPFTAADKSSATSKLVNAGFPTLSTGEIDYESIGKYNYKLMPETPPEKNYIILTDSEISAILNEVLSSGILVSNFPELSYINTLSMEVKQFVIAPASFNEEITFTDAKLLMTIKLDTLSARRQIAENLEVPQFLIDFIIPDIIYMTASFDTNMSDDNVRQFSNGTIAINSKTAKQSEVIMNLLISFVYPNEENILIESLTHQIGKLMLEGLDVLGEFQFTNTSELLTNDYGIKLMLNI